MEQKVKNSIADEIRSIVLKRFLIKVIINGIAITLLISSVLFASSADLVLSIGFMILVFGVTLGRSYRQKKEQLSDALIIRNFDREFSEMENSSHLLLHDYSQLNDLEKLQYEKLRKQITGIIDRFQPHVRIRRAQYFLIFSLFTSAIIILVTILSGNKEEHQESEYQTRNLENITKSVNAIETPTPQKMEVGIFSPEYTRIRSKRSLVEDLDIVENSVLKFSVNFSDEVDEVILTLNSQQIPFEKVENDYELSVIMRKASIYQISYTFQDSLIQASKLHQIKVRIDESPEIEVTGLDSYQIIEEAYGDPSFGIRIKDDYGIRDGHIVATITKGEGESVKFREENIPFNSRIKNDKTSYNGRQEINLKDLGMEPGDELYFYVHASDNRDPEANISRSQTFFIVMPDSARDVVTMSAGIGVDLMPEYFRSQRQIIIDTEKLIAEEGTISKKEFDSRSNELGYDQKQLRLRYGQFMGEEFETEIGGSLSAEDQDHDHEGENEVVGFDNILKRFGHAHDTEDVADRGVLEIDNHDHGHDHGSDEMEELEKGKDAESILEELTHSHDSEENATLFFESSKVKLRAALSLMWTSELHLRLSEPETALPVEYEILKLLKEVQQMSRIYVERIGFDPPPIKEYEKRLTGDFKEISSYENVETPQELESFTETRSYIAYLDYVLNEQQSPYSLSDKGIKEVKSEISMEIQKDPLKYFKLIEVIQLVEAGKSVSAQDVLFLQKSLIELMGQSNRNDLNQDGNLNPLNEIYLQEITNSKP